MCRVAESHKGPTRFVAERLRIQIDIAIISTAEKRSGENRMIKVKFFGPTEDADLAKRLKDAAENVAGKVSYERDQTSWAWMEYDILDDKPVAKALQTILEETFGTGDKGVFVDPPRCREFQIAFRK
jgi:hypothetical protein